MKCASVEGVLYKDQTDYTAEPLEQYKRHVRTPQIEDYKRITA